MIELDYVGGCRALDQAETSERSGPGADARAYLVLRPYVKTAVEVTVVRRRPIRCRTGWSPRGARIACRSGGVSPRR